MPCRRNVGFGPVNPKTPDQGFDHQPPEGIAKKNTFKTMFFSIIKLGIIAGMNL